MNEIYGYVRASSKDQNEDRQLIALSDFPVPQKNIYMDKLSGKDFNMPQYKRLLNMIEEEDVLVIKSIDRLGREVVHFQRFGEALEKTKDRLDA